MRYEFECPDGHTVERDVPMDERHSIVILCPSEEHKDEKPRMKLKISAQRIVHSSAGTWRK